MKLIKNTAMRGNNVGERISDGMTLDSRQFIAGKSLKDESVRDM
jgi:hypothetical protein